MWTALTKHFKNLLAKKHSKRASAARRPGRRLLLEPLEDRYAPAVISVVSVERTGSVSASVSSKNLVNGFFNVEEGIPASSNDFVDDGIVAESFSHPGTARAGVGVTSQEEFVGLFYVSASASVYDSQSSVANPSYEVTGLASATVQAQMTVMIEPEGDEQGGQIVQLRGSLDRVLRGASAQVSISNPSGGPITLEFDPVSDQPYERAGFETTAKIGGTVTINISASAGTVGLGNQSAQVYVNWLDADRPDVFTQLSTALDGDEIGGNHFGPYLPGVGFDVPFVVDVTDSANNVAYVKWRPPHLSNFVAATAAGDQQWTFNYNVEPLAPGNHDLIVQTFDVNNQPIGNEITATIFMESRPVDFELKASVPGGSPVDVESLRFLRSVNLDVAFHGTITNVPTYYHDKIHVLLNNVDMSPSSLEQGDNQVSFTKQMDGGTLPAGATPGAPVDAIVKIGTTTLAQISGDGPEKVLAINVPAWLKNGDLPTFSDGAYHLEDVTISALKYEQKYVKTGIPWLDGPLQSLSTEFSLTPVLTLTVPLVRTADITITGSRFEAKATFFGNAILDANYGSGDVQLVGSLDGTTLMPNGFGLKLSGPKAIADVTLFNKQITIPLFKAGLVGVNFRLEVALLGAVTVNKAAILIQSQGGNVELDPRGTVFEVTGLAKAPITAALDAVLVFGLAQYEVVSASVTIELGLHANVHFKKSPTNPQVDSAALTATLGGHYSFNIIGLPVKKDVPFPSADADGAYQPYQLFSVSAGTPQSSSTKPPKGNKLARSSPRAYAAWRNGTFSGGKPPKRKK